MRIVQFDFFLWPIILPMILPFVYSLKYKRESLMEIISIILSMMFIVISYWPLTRGFAATANIITKFILFVFFPLCFIYIAWRINNKSKESRNDFPFDQFGLSEHGFEKSLKLGLISIPLMILVTYIAQTQIVTTPFTPDIAYGVVSFVESFTEEFFFRGILFLFLLRRTNLTIAYFTSFTSFLLMHHPNFTSIFILSTIVQGFITIEICRRSKNLVGAWIVHGSNRFFSIVLLPFFI